MDMVMVMNCLMQRDDLRQTQTFVVLMTIRSLRRIAGCKLDKFGKKHKRTVYSQTDMMNK